MQGRKTEQREEILETSSLIHVETVGHRAGQAEPGRQESKQSEAAKKNKGRTYGSLKSKPRLSLHTGVTETIWHWRIKKRKKKGTAQIHRRAGEVTRRRWK